MTHLSYMVRKFFRRLFGTQKLHDEIEQLQVQLAGCSVASYGGTHSVATKGMYGWSPSYQDVLNLRNRYDDLRIKYDDLLKYRHWDIGYRNAVLPLYIPTNFGGKML